MHYSRIPLFSLLASVVLAGVAVAATTWQTVNVDSQPGLAIDLPAIIGDDYKPSSTSQQVLLDYGLTAEDEGALDCTLEQFFYTADVTREKMLARIADGSTDIFCEENGATIKGWAAVDSGKANVDGEPAGTCSSVYTDSSDKEPGHFETALVVAGRTRAYLLSCQISDDDKEDADLDYDDHWKDEIGHMQESLHIPPSER